jgi:hypothetical protein
MVLDSNLCLKVNLIEIILSGTNQIRISDLQSEYFPRIYLSLTCYRLILCRWQFPIYDKCISLSWECVDFLT